MGDKEVNRCVASLVAALALNLFAGKLDNSTLVVCSVLCLWFGVYLWYGVLVLSVWCAGA